MAAGDSAFVAAIENAHFVDREPDAWLQELIGAIRPALDEGDGIFGWFYDVSQLPQIQLTNPVLQGVDPNVLQAIMKANADPISTPALVRKHFATPAGSFSYSLGDHFPQYTPWQDHLYPLNIKDLVIINALDVSQRGCAMSAPRKQVTQLSPTRIALLERVAAHIAAADRIRRRLSSTDPAERTLAATESILSPDGNVEHAEGISKEAEVRATLSHAVKAAERARGRLRHIDVEEAVGTWQAMVGGRWTLVDQFDSDGRRYVVARLNEPKPTRFVRLGLRERQVVSWAALGHSNKLIAYELGIDVSTVATHLQRAKEKLRVSGLAEMAPFFGMNTSERDVSEDVL